MNYSLWFHFCFHFFLFFTFFLWRGGGGGVDKFVTPIKDGDVSKRQYRG